MAFSPDGQTLAAASAHNQVWRRNLAEPGVPRSLGTLTGPTSYTYHVAFSPDGRTLAAASADGSVYRWSIGGSTHSYPPLAGPLGIVYAVAFTPDGHTLATANTDRTVLLWDVADSNRPTVRATLRGFDSTVFSVAISPNGHTLAAAGRDRTVRLWDIDPQRVADAVCTHAGTPLTPNEWRTYFGTAPYTPPCL